MGMLALRANWRFALPLLMACGMLPASVSAQLRTGRGERSFYDVEEGVGMPRVAQVDLPSLKRATVVESPVTHASINRPIRSQPTYQSQQKPNHQNHASHVVTAACPNCQSEDLIEGGEVLPSDVMRTRNARSTLACDSCDSYECNDGRCLMLGNGLILSWMERAYFRVESASFWQSSVSLPGLVTTGTVTADPDDFIPNQNLFGGRVMNGDPFSGFRISVGSWFDDCQDRGFLFRYVDSATLSTDFNGDQTTNSVLARRFFDTTGAAQNQIVSYPVTTVLTNGAPGSIRASLNSNVVGFEALLKNRLAQNDFARWDWIGGYRSLSFDETLSISTSTQSGSVILDVSDRFDTSNDFRGATLGISRLGRLGNWSLESVFQLGLGNLRRTVQIQGTRRTTTDGNPPSVFEDAQGLLARQTNAGTFQDNTFAVVPEVGLTLGYRLTYSLDFTVGYNLIGLPKVARAGDQLDPNLQVNLSDPLIGAARPQFSLAEQNLSLHSLNLGAQWRY